MRTVKNEMSDKWNLSPNMHSFSSSSGHWKGLLGARLFGGAAMSASHGKRWSNMGAFERKTDVDFVPRLTAE